VHLPLQRDAEALLDRIDGLLLPGGDDLRPPRDYPDRVCFELVPDAQLDFDRRLLAGARARGLPTLGICYGMQLLALACGGALLYDIPTDRPEAERHDLRGPDERHPIEIVPGSRLASILGGAAREVNSLHHQGVDDAGTATVAARSRDGLIEAIEVVGERFCVGVQWHPEKLDGAHRRDLFAAFVDAARAR
jgi:putative glutamine amidotransferase